MLDYKIVGLFSKHLTNWNFNDFKKSDLGTSPIEKDYAFISENSEIGLPLPDIKLQGCTSRKKKIQNQIVQEQ